MDLSILESRLGVRFKNRSYLWQALTHQSYPGQNTARSVGNNERLEFLGDSVLQLIVTEFLFRTYPKEREGFLTCCRAALVNSTTLSLVSKELTLGDFLLRYGDEVSNPEILNASVLGDTFEAIVGAIYLDRGYEAVRQFVSRVLLPKVDDIISRGLWRSPKTYLQEVAYKTLGIIPTYTVIQRNERQEDSHLVVSVSFGLDLIAIGQGRTKKIAEADAAKKALAIKGWDIVTR